MPVGIPPEARLYDHVMRYCIFSGEVPVDVRRLFPCEVQDVVLVRVPRYRWTGRDDVTHTDRLKPPFCAPCAPSRRLSVLQHLVHPVRHQSQARKATIKAVTLLEAMLKRNKLIMKTPRVAGNCQQKAVSN